MVALSVILGLAALNIDLVFSGSVCSQEPYKALQILSAFPPAESFCSSKFPLPACTSTVTSTSTSVVLASTTTTVATVEDTVTTLSTTTTTGTTTLDVTTSTTVIDTTTTTDIVVTGTTTITTTSVPMKKREAEVTTLQTVAKRGNPLQSLLSSLSSEAYSVIQTACSCIEALPTCGTTTTTTIVPSTTTNTVSVTETDSVTATSVIDVEQTIISSITEIDTTTTTTTTTEDVLTTTTSVVCASNSVPSNGNFETDTLTPWTLDPSSQVSASVVAGGLPPSKYCLQSGTLDNSNRFGVYQRLATCANVKYTCTYNWKFSVFVLVDNHIPFIDIAINDFEVDETDFDSDSAGFWNTDEFTFVGTGDDYIYVTAESPGTTANQLELDNFSCKHS